MRAPVTIETGDLGAVSIFADIVPRRFPLLRAKVERLEAGRRKPIDRIIASKQLPITDIPDDSIIAEFRDEEVSKLPWKSALIAVSRRHGLTDEAGRPKNAWARRIVAKGRQVHLVARRDLPERNRLWEAFHAGKVKTVDDLNRRW